MVATAPRKGSRVVTATAAPDTDEQIRMGEDGYPERRWVVDGETRWFSLRPYEPSAREVYWNPAGNGQQMWIRSQEYNHAGILPVIQKETWWDGKFSPRNDWERQVMQEWMVRVIEGCSDPELWKGFTHPDGPDHAWRCQCGWLCGNWKAFAQHRRSTGHRESLSE